MERMETTRLTMAQALVRALAAQSTDVDGVKVSGIMFDAGTTASPSLTAPA